MTRIRKGVSPVIATVLLILVAVAATVIIWTWVSGAAANNPTSQPALQEKITIDAVKYISGDNQVTIYVTNLGPTTVTITAGYVLDANNGTAVCQSTFTTNNQIDPQSTQSFTVTCTNSLEAGRPYTAKVVTSNGVSATYNFNG